MASGTIQTGSTLYYVDDTQGRGFTFTSSSGSPSATGYYNLVNSGTLPVPAGAKIVAVGMVTWSGNTTPFSLCAYSDNQVYAFGEVGESVSGLKCRFWYTF